jgi:lipopolysaccharide/colanic/teichoic acid biosynthesis glycosyltransferase
MGTIITVTAEEPSTASGALGSLFATRARGASTRSFTKKAIDCAIGLVGSLATLLMMPFIALLLMREDTGPVFHRRGFVDCDGAVRYYLKFRTMVTDADVRLQEDPELRMQFDFKYKLQHDPRVLRIGRILRKYSIDEFPQFFSLLSGKLTFVGPRVISKEETSRYGELLPKLLSVKPGMTGYWQVMGRQKTSYAERIRMDMFYVDNWSLKLDFIIMAKTIWQVLRGDGAY